VSDAARDAHGRFVDGGHARYESRADGYCRWRAYDPATGRDRYVYVHQLLACVEHDPRAVFDPDNEVHHADGVRWHNAPGNVEVREAVDHAEWHLHGRALP
jgi:hypothetical protein